MAAMPTEEEMAYMQEHIHDTLVPNVIASCAVSSGFAVVIAALRVYVRYTTIKKLILSDYLMITSVVFFVAFCTIFGLSTRYGAGRHGILITDPADMRMLGILNMLNPILYGIATAFVKASILSLYINIFPQKVFVRWVYAITTLNFLGAVVIVLVTCLQCRPIEALWGAATGTCIDFSIFSLFNTSYNFVLDVAILASPLPLVRKLNLSRRKRVVLTIYFGLGGGACVVAAIRLPYARKVGGTSNPSWDMIPGGMLCVAEVVVAILCSSLPIYRPLLGRIPGLGSAIALSSYKGSGNGGTSSNLGNRRVSYSVGSTLITAGGSRGPHRQGVAVTEDVNMTRHAYVDGKWARVYDDDDDETRLVSMRR